MPLAENDTVATIGQRGRRVWLYPQRVIGRFVRARTRVAYVLLALLLVAPWIDVGGNPAMRFDIPARRFHFWGLNLLATDGWYLLFAAGVLIFGVFFFTALLGRVWCGWACPQTVFLETLIRPIEQLIEGKPSERKRLDAAPWTAGKIAKKVAKWGAFLVVAGTIATTFTAYFLGRHGVIEAQFHPFTHPFGTATFLFLTGLLYFDFAWFREQTCVVVCPYGRFQSVLMDGDSLAIVYDTKRGEPRGKVGTPDAGACVDCRRCVQACPTGVDIRKGVQLECVMCMSCMDACDDVMERLGRPTGLIRFASERSVREGRLRLVRPRVVAYGAALVAVLALFGLTVARREPVELRLTRQVGAPYAQLADGRIQNGVRLRLSNRSGEPRTFTVTVVEPADVQLVNPLAHVTVAPEQVEHVPLFIIRPDPHDEHGRSHVVLEITDDHGFRGRVTEDFLSPGHPEQEHHDEEEHG
jgi:cytochrome c oxidase accessory protein FixG